MDNDDRSVTYIAAEPQPEQPESDRAVTYVTIEGEDDPPPPIVHVYVARRADDPPPYQQTSHRSGRPVAFDMAPPDPLTRAHDLNRTPALAKRVLKRLETGGRPLLVGGLRVDQQALAVELVENGRSVGEVARAFNVADDVVRRLVE